VLAAAKAEVAQKNLSEIRVKFCKIYEHFEKYSKISLHLAKNKKPIKQRLMGFCSYFFWLRR
jgi:hypothetical protein